MKSLSPISRVLILALISGVISGVITLALMLFVWPTFWFLFIIPAIMGTVIYKFANITCEDVNSNENLSKKVGWICASVVLFFVLIIAAFESLVLYATGSPWWIMLLEIPFYIASGLAIFYGYNRGVQAVTDAYYDGDLERVNSDSED